MKAIVIELPEGKAIEVTRNHNTVYVLKIADSENGAYENSGFESGYKPDVEKRRDAEQSQFPHLFFRVFEKTTYTYEIPVA